MRRRVFDVVYSLAEGGAWNARVLRVRGCVTWGRSVEAVRRHVREALSTCVDVLGPDAEEIAHSCELIERFALPRPARLAVDRYLASSRRAEVASSAAARAAERAVRALTREGHLSLRDTGSLLGLSHERVNQIDQTARTRSRPRRASA